MGAPVSTSNRIPVLGRATLCGLSMVVLGRGALSGGGTLTTQGLLCVMASLGLAVLALRPGDWSQPRRWWLIVTVTLGFGNLLYADWLGLNHGAQVDLALLLVALTGVAAWLPEGRRAWACLAGAAVTLVALMSVNWVWGQVDVDVFDSVSRAATNLVHGQNPYDATFTLWTEPAPFVRGPAIAHFGYGPVVPLLAAPGLLLGDVRLMSVVALAAMLAGLWYLARQGRQRAHAHRILALGLASPFIVGMVHFAWVDVYMMAGLVGWLALRHRHRRWAMVCLGIALLVKPTALVVLVPYFLWSRRARIEMAVAGLGAAIFALPFVLVTGIGTFFNDVIGTQLAYPIRYEALTLTSFLWQRTGLTLPSILTALVVLAGAAIIAWRGRPRDESDLGLQVVVITVAGFLVAKWAFPNYYFISEVMLLTAIAAAGVGFTADEVGLPWASIRRWRWRHELTPARPAAVPA